MKRPQEANTSPILELELNVTGMSCQGCVSKVRKMIQEKSPEAIVEGTPKEHKLKVTSGLSLASIEASIQDAGYQFLGVSDSNELAHSEGDEKLKVDSDNVEAKKVKSELPENSSSYQFFYFWYDLCELCKYSTNGFGEFRRGCFCRC